MYGKITRTKVDPEVAELQRPMKAVVQHNCRTKRTERLFSFRWHPYAIEPGMDYSKEPTTLVTFPPTVVVASISAPLAGCLYGRQIALRRFHRFHLMDASGAGLSAARITGRSREEMDAREGNRRCPSLVLRTFEYCQSEAGKSTCSSV